MIKFDCYACSLVCLKVEWFVVRACSLVLALDLLHGVNHLNAWVCGGGFFFTRW